MRDDKTSYVNKYIRVIQIFIYILTSGECFENKWFYMKYIGKYFSIERLLTCEDVTNFIVVEIII